jgi:heptosyltransferase-2
MGLEWKRDKYILALSSDEKELVARRRSELLKVGANGVIGYNTGCSLLYPNKKFTVERGIELIRAWRAHFPDKVVALLGGREDAERQEAMKKAFATDPFVVSTPTSEGLRSGILWMATADLVFTGCSLGLHISIALDRPTIVWFGVSCAQEIDLYDKGIKLQSEVSCSPCWRKSCDQRVMCYDRVEISSIIDASARLLKS